MIGSRIYLDYVDLLESANVQDNNYCFNFTKNVYLLVLIGYLSCTMHLVCYIKTDKEWQKERTLPTNSFQISYLCGACLVIGGYSSRGITFEI